MASARAPICPRCGYDQSGAVATWSDSCPLRGRCPECGLEFGWDQAYFPERERLRGFHEHARSASERRLWPWVTLAWTLLPWVFWRRVTVFVQPRPGRTLLWPLATVGPIWLAGAVIAAGWGRAAAPNLAVEVFNSLADPVVRYDEWASLRGWGMAAPRSRWNWDPRQYLRHAAPFAAYGLAWPALFAVLGETMRRCRLRRAHVLRAAVYSFAWLPLLAGLLLADKAYVAFIENSAFWTGFTGLASRPSELVFRFRPYLAAGLWAWISLWWLLAIARGFRLPRAWLVWLLLGVAAALVAANAALAPYWIWGATGGRGR